MTETLLDQVESCMRSALGFNENAEVAPVVLLWPDRARQFGAVVKALGPRMPIVTLGEWDPTGAAGPAYWVRCAVAGTVELYVPDGTPVVYLPGVGPEDLRAIEGCPRDLAPLAELQYRGQWFTHPNGKDWTIRALLTNKERGLGLDVADNHATHAALLGAFSELLSLPVRRLSQHIDAEFLQRLLNPDLAGQLLEWLDDPNGFRSRQKSAKWDAFIGLCKSEYDFDPGADGEVTGGRLLGEHDGSWAEVWRRFAADPERYAGVQDRLRKGKPEDQLFSVAGSWPQDNEEAEADLRQQLTSLAGTPAGDARKKIALLWNEHRERQHAVWAQLDRAPAAFVLEHIQRLCELTAAGPADDVATLVSLYSEGGWQADSAFLAALRAAGDDAVLRKVAADAALAVYRPWIDAHARALQTAIGPIANAGTYIAGPAASTTPGVVTVFVDGLRLDLAQEIAERLAGEDVAVQTHLAALPTVTATAKPVLTPTPDDALGPGNDLGPARATNGAKASIAVLRGLMVERGGQVLNGAETGDPTGWAWAEAGEVDSRGHKFGAAFVADLVREVNDIAKRVALLLDAGWKQVEIVTDHGWLLVPGGMERADLSPAAVEVKKGRCARLKEGADVSIPTVPWHWDANVSIGLAPGISCFEANKEYEHGGVSLQECVVPRVIVRRGEAQPVTGGAAITSVKWLGLMCRIQFENVALGATVDIRALPADPTTSVTATVKETSSAEKQSLHVEDEDLEGEAAYLVIVGDDGAILAQRDVTIGQNR